MSEKPVKITDNAKKPTIIIFLVLLLLLFIRFPLSSVGFMEMLGSLTAHLFFGVVVGNIYFVVKKSARTNWQRYKVILIISLLFLVIKDISKLF